MDALSASALTGASDAVTLLLKIGGMIMLWNGLMKIAEASGLVKIFSKFLRPLINFLFPDLKKEEKARELIAMNMSANMLGLGNAATPLGLRAMKELKRIGGKDKASRSMTMLVVINTASIQLIPVTVAAIRQSFGSADPFDIMPAVWISSVLALAVGVAALKMFEKFHPEKYGRISR